VNREHISDGCSESTTAPNEISVIGLMLLKDEWPLCAVSISHLLSGHVDTLWVADHGSGPETRRGLEQLRRLWGDRLQVLRFNEVEHWQEAATGVLLQACDAKADDWIYVVDADEFVLTEPGTTLRTLLLGMDDETAVIRYEVHNWISTTDFDEHSLDSYRALVHRSSPEHFESKNETPGDEIRAGTLNYFDLRFLSKVMFRRGASSWPANGAHSLKGPNLPEELKIAPTELRVAHLPMLTRERLEGRAKRGKYLRAAGFPKTHGWQSQMLYEISKDDALDSFWEHHSIGYGSNSVGFKPPTSRFDDDLIKALVPTLGMLAGQLGRRLDLDASQSDVPEGAADDSLIPMTTSIGAVRSIQVVANDLSARVIQITGERDELVAELVAVRDELVAERDALIVDRDNREREQHRLGEELAAMRDSTSWRVTGPLRRATGWLRRRRAIAGGEEGRGSCEQQPYSEDSKSSQVERRPSDSEYDRENPIVAALEVSTMTAGISPFLAGVDS